MSMEFYSENTHIAKKEHKCEMCGGKINIGEKYYRERGKFCGEFFDRKMHVHCHHMEAEYCREVDCEFNWYSIYDYVRDKHCCGECADWVMHNDCKYRMAECPKLIELYREMEVKK